jgi:DNA-binding GntR family transcriptional regulator
LFEIVHQKVMKQRDPQLLATLKAGITLLEGFAKLEDDAGMYAETSYRLSIVTVRSCGNSRLIRMITALSLQTLRYSRISLKSKEQRQRSAAMWRKAITALERGDGEQYMKLMRKRIEESGAEAVRQLSAAL